MPAEENGRFAQILSKICRPRTTVFLAQQTNKKFFYWLTANLQSLKVQNYSTVGLVLVLVLVPVPVPVQIFEPGPGPETVI